MTHVFPFYGDIYQCWNVFYSEHHRLSEVLGRSAFEFQSPKHSTIHEYLPKDGDEIIVYFWDTEHKQTLMVVEAEIIPDEDRQYNIFVNPQGGNSFEEPLKSAMSIWMKIKKALKKAEKRRAINVSKRKKRGGPHESTLFALDSLRKTYSQVSKNRLAIITRKEAAKKAGIAINTWCKHDQKLWNHWEDDGY